MADDSKRIWDKYERFQGLSNRWLEENPKMKRADSTYRDVIGNLIGAAYGGYRDRAKIGLDDVRAARAMAQPK